MWMGIRSIAISKYSLDDNAIINIKQSNVDVSQIKGNCQVFFSPQCYYHYYVIQCGCKSDW